MVICHLGVEDPKVLFMRMGPSDVCTRALRIGEPENRHKSWPPRPHIALAPIGPSFPRV